MKELKELVGSAKAAYGNLSDEKLALMGYVRTKEDKTGKTESEIEYWNHVHGESSKLNYTDKQRKVKIHESLCVQVALRGENQFEFTKENRKLLAQMYDLMKSGTKKGFFVHGNTGCGKTTMLKAVLGVPYEPIYPEQWLTQKPIVTSCITVVSDYNKYKDLGDYLRRERYFDDLGSEPKQDYAGKEGSHLFEQVIELRYVNAVKTHFTSNLDMEQIKQRYGTRVFSRLHEMCHVIEYKDKDWRVE